MSQFGRPSSDVTNTGLTGGFGSIDESVASDTDYWGGDNNQADTLEVLLSSLSDPLSSTGHIFRYRVAKSDSDGSTPDGAGSAVTVTASLWQGGTQIATDTAKTATGTWTQYSYTLTSGEADAITDYTDLRLRFVTSASGGNPSSRRAGAVSWAELEVPDAGSLTPVSLSGAIAPSGGILRQARKALAGLFAGPTAGGGSTPTHSTYYAELAAATLVNPTVDVTGVAWSAGDRVVVVVTGRDEGLDGGAPTVTDSGSFLTYSNVGFAESAQSVIYSGLWKSGIAASAQSGVTITVSITESSHAGGINVAVIVLHGTSPDIDVWDIVDTGATDTTTPSIDLTTTVDSTRAFAFFQTRSRTFVVDSGDSLTVITEIGENNQVDAGGNVSSMSAYYKDVASAGAFNASGTLSTALDWQVVAFAAKTSGGSGTPGAIAGALSAVNGLAIHLTGAIAAAGSIARQTGKALAGAFGVTTYAHDTFTRTGSPGFGTPDVGPDWTAYDATDADWATTGSTGTVSVPDSAYQNATIGDGAIEAVDAVSTIKFRYGALPEGGFHILAFYGRRQLDILDKAIKADIRVDVSGNITAKAENKVGGVNTNIVAYTSTGLTVAANDWIWADMEIEGQYPNAHVRVRVWLDGTSRPSTPLFDATTTGTDVDAGGTTGVWVQGSTSGSQVTWPVVFEVDEISLTGLAGTGGGIAGSVSVIRTALLALSGAITSAGSTARQTAKSVAGAIVSAAALAVSGGLSISLSGAIATAGGLARETRKGLAGSASAAATIVRQSAHSFAGTVPSSGAFGAIKTILRSFAGALAPASGSGLTKQVNKGLAGSASSAGSFARMTGKGLTGAVTMAASLIKHSPRSFAGTVTTAGTFVAIKAALRTFGGAIGSAGSLTRSTSKSAAGTIGSAGSLVKTTALSFVGSIASSASLLAERVTGSFQRTFGGAIAPGGSLTKSSTTALAGTVSLAGAFVKRTSKSFAGTVTSSASVVLIKALLRSFSGVLGSSGALSRSVGKALTGTIATAGSLARRTAKAFASTIASAATLVAIRPGQTFQRSFAGTMASAGAFQKEVRSTFSGTVASAGTLVRRVAKDFAGYFTPPYRSAVMGLDPLAYWRLGESSGSVIADEVGGLDGTYVGSPTLGEPGLIEDADTSVIATTDNWLSFPNGSIAPGQFTVACWFQTAIGDPGIFNYMFLGAGWASDGLAMGHVWTNPGGTFALHLQFYVTNGVNYPFVDMVTTPDEPHFVVGTYDGSTIRLYVDGVEGTPEPFTHSPAGGSLQTYQLTTPLGLDEVKTFDRALTPQEVLDLYRSGTTGHLSASLVRSFLHPLSGSLTMAGSLARQSGLALTGAITTAGSLTKRVSKTLAGAIASAGVLTRVVPGTFFVAVGGTIASSGSFATLKLRQVLLVASRTSGAAVARVRSAVSRSQSSTASRDRGSTNTRS